MHTVSEPRSKAEIGRGQLGHVFLMPEADALSLKWLAENVSTRFISSDDPQLLLNLPVLADEIPGDLRRELTEFRLSDKDGLLIIRGSPIDQDRIGPTPSDWRGKTLPGAAFVEEIMALLVASLLGDPFAWRTQQDGHLVHEVFPIRQDESAQLGTSSRVLLTWHTEDAFHPCRADYVLIQALRNSERVPTMVGGLNLELIDLEVLPVLFTQRFIIKPDNSHLAEYNSAKSPAGGFDFAEIEHMRTAPEPVAVLFGDQQAPYVRLDPYFMDTLPGDDLAKRALAAVEDAIERSLADVVLEAGDIIILDNLKVVHGRRPFQARYDGTDRWLKRINVTRDLRKSRGHRASPTCRLVR